MDLLKVNYNYKPRNTYMYYLVTVDYKCMVQHLTSRVVKGFKNCCISNVVDGSDDSMLWNGGQEDMNVRS